MAHRIKASFTPRHHNSRNAAPNPYVVDNPETKRILDLTDPEIQDDEVLVEDSENLNSSESVDQDLDDLSADAVQELRNAASDYLDQHAVAIFSRAFGKHLDDWLVEHGPTLFAQYMKPKRKEVVQKIADASVPKKK